MELLRTYNFEPQFPEVTDEQAVNILGVEGALWDGIRLLTQPHGLADVSPAFGGQRNRMSPKS